MNTEKYYKEVVEPTLNLFGIFRPELAKILVMTANHESGLFKHKRQVGGGPGNGYCQVETGTHNDIWESYLIYRKSAENITQHFFNIDAKTFIKNKQYLNERDTLINNDSYNCLMAAITYIRRELTTMNDTKMKEKIPTNVNDIVALAKYWKRHYNTAGGKGTVEKFLRDWENRKSV
jgi:hypothetical protein